MNSTPPAAGLQPRLYYARPICAGCASKVAPPFDTLTDDEGHIGFLCGRCSARHEDDAVFAMVVGGCVLDGTTLPEVTAAFAVYGLAVPTTSAQRRAAAAVIAEMGR